MKNTTKRLLAAAAAIMMLASLSACSDKDSSDSKDTSSETTQSAADSTADEDKKDEEAKDAAPAAAEGADIEALNKKIEELSARVDELEQRTDEFNFGEDYHEVYDDTAVVEAYNKKDPSGLTDEKDKYIYDCLVEAVDEIIKDGMTEYEKEKAVYDYIFKGRSFDYDNLNPIDWEDISDENSHNPYGFFHDHNTICVGNATTFKLFMDVLGIDCMIIHSVEQGEHAWNVVKIDGDWYHVDITFDGGDSEPMYSCFNVTDAAKDNGGYPWDHDEFPACTATKYNYVLMNAQKVEDVYELPKLLKKAIEDDESVLYLTFIVPEGAEPYLYYSQIDAVLNSLESEKYYFSTGEPMMNDDMTEMSLAIGIYSMDDEPDWPGWEDGGDDEDGDTGIDLEKMRDAFDKEFDGEVKVSDELNGYYGGYEPNSFYYTEDAVPMG